MGLDTSTSFPFVIGLTYTPESEPWLNLLAKSKEFPEVSKQNGFLLMD